jgi:hypothetical protein
LLLILNLPLSEMRNTLEDCGGPLAIVSMVNRDGFNNNKP